MNAFYLRIFPMMVCCLAVSAQSVAQCTSQAGSMSTALLTQCENLPATADYNNSGEVLDADDLLRFALHTTAGNALGVVIATHTAPTFSFVPASMSYGTTYYISALVGNDDGNGNVDPTDPCLSVAPGTPVVFLPVPTATMSGSAEVCPGDTATLPINLSGEAPWTVGWQANGVTQVPISASSTPYTLPVNPSVTSIYNLSSVTDANGCQGLAAGFAVVAVHETPTVSNLQVTCLPNNEEFTVSFDISGGVPGTYIITPPAGTLSGNTFTSFPIANGGIYTFAISDANGCSPVVVTSVAPCPQCTTSAGSMDLSPITVALCDDEQAIALHNNDAALDPNDALVFILHTLPGDSLGFIHQTSTLPVFSFLPATMQYGVTYYISAVAGNGDGTGGVDMNDPCLHISEGTPVTFNPAIVLDCSVPFSCAGFPVVPVCSVSGDAPFTYQWMPTGGVSDPTILNPVISFPGTYLLTVTNGSGCSASVPVVVVQSSPFSLSVNNPIPALSCANPVVNIAVTIVGGTPPFNYFWSNGSTGMVLPATAPGLYTVTVTDANGCSSLITVQVSFENIECGVIKGTVLFDADEQCDPDPGEQGLSGWMVQAIGNGSFYGMTNSTGGYSMSVPKGSYVVDLIPPNTFYWEACQTAVNTTLLNANDIKVLDFQAKKLVDCAFLEVDIGAFNLRRCTDRNITVNYCNKGTAPADDAYVELEFPPLLTYVSSSIPWSSQNGNIYTFDLGEIEPGECGSFVVKVFVACDAVLGQTLCTRASIYPDSLCIPISPQWSGASIQVASECTPDSVIFIIQNAGFGDMSQPSQYIVVEDGVMLMTPQDFQLQSGELLTLSFPANGSTYTLLAEQVAGHPGFSAPVLSVEGCGVNGVGSFSTGFVSQFPEDDGAPAVSIECRPVVGSFDPNDKNGYPLGYGNQHFIEPGQELDYHIRFQNTGTDTAFKVVIQDVLSPFLDITTLRPGTSSHPYLLDIQGQDTLLFIFENIALPDSNVNEPASHGFVKFRIGQVAGLPLGTVIGNSAAIFFDSNAPVLTNTTQHKLGEQFIMTPSRQPEPAGIRWKVFPNPFSETLTCVVEGAGYGEVNFHLYDLMGRHLKKTTVRDGVAIISRGWLSPGFYFYKIRVNGEVVGNGKVAVR